MKFTFAMTMFGLVLGLLLSACGGGGDSGSNGATTDKLTIIGSGS